MLSSNFNEIVILITFYAAKNVLIFLLIYNNKHILIEKTHIW